MSILISTQEPKISSKFRLEKIDQVNILKKKIKFDLSQLNIHASFQPLSETQFKIIISQNLIFPKFKLNIHINFNCINSKCKLQGFLTKNDTYFSIISKQHRICIGKQLLKQQQKNPWYGCILINIFTGQIKIKFPQYNSKINFQCFLLEEKLLNLIKSINKLIIPIKKMIKKLLIITNQIQQSLYSNDKILSIDPYQRIRKFLMLLTITPSFEFTQGTSAFALIENSYLNQLLQIQKISKNLEIQSLQWFNYLKYYTIDSKILINYLKTINLKITHGERVKLKDMVFMPIVRTKSQSLDNKYITNRINVKIPFNKEIIHKTGFNTIYKAKINFSYVLSDDFRNGLIKNNQNQKNNIISKMVAVKIPLSTQRSTKKIKHQIQILLRLKGGASAYLPKFYIPSNKQLNNSILIDYYPKSSLSEYMIDTRLTSSIWTKIFIMFNIVQGLRYLQKHGIIHMDLKPQNILILKKIMLTKLIDFGDSYHPQICEQIYNPGYTIPYAPPERFSSNPNKRYTQKYDIYAIGMIMHQFFFRRFPFQSFHLHTQQIQKKIIICPQYVYDFGEIRTILIIFHLTMKCTQNNPQHRPCLDWLALTLRQCLNIFKDSR